MYAVNNALTAEQAEQLGAGLGTFKRANDRGQALADLAVNSGWVAEENADLLKYGVGAGSLGLTAASHAGLLPSMATIGSGIATAATGVLGTAALPVALVGGGLLAGAGATKLWNARGASKAAKAKLHARLDKIVADVKDYQRLPNDGGGPQQFNLIRPYHIAKNVIMIRDKDALLALLDVGNVPIYAASDGTQKVYFAPAVDVYNLSRTNKLVKFAADLQQKLGGGSEQCRYISFIYPADTNPYLFDDEMDASAVPVDVTAAKTRPPAAAAKTRRKQPRKAQPKAKKRTK
jgi:hypothetical protein